MDGLGNSYVAGFFDLMATFGPGEPNETTLTSAGRRAADIFVAKFGPIATLTNEINILEENGALQTSKAKQLLGLLRKTERHFSRGQTEQTIAALQLFITKVILYIKNGFLLAGDGQPLIDIASESRNNLIAVSNSIVNDKVNFVVKSTSFNPTSVPGGPAGTFTVTAVLTNKSTENILEPINAIVKTLTNGNKLLSATEGNGGVGSKQAIDAGSDDILIPKESTTVQFRIGLANRNRFSFFVDVSGTVNGAD